MNNRENTLTQFLNDRLDSRLRGLRRAGREDLIELQGALREIVIIMKELNVPMREGLAERLSNVSFARGAAKTNDRGP